MAFKLVSSQGSVVDPTVVELEATGAVSIGDCVEYDRQTHSGAATKFRLTRANGTYSAYQKFGIAASANASGTGVIKVIPINDMQMWEADTTSLTTQPQVGNCVALWNYACLTNATHESGTAGAFEILATKGATSDYKVIGRFTRVPVDDI